MHRPRGRGGERGRVITGDGGDNHFGPKMALAGLLEWGRSLHSLPCIIGFLSVETGFLIQLIHFLIVRTF